MLSAIVQNGDSIRIDLNNYTVTLNVDPQEIEKRFDELKKAGGFKIPKSQTPWQQYFREMVSPFSEGMVLRDASKYQSVAQKYKPRNNH